MPELPEIEHLRSTLRPALLGRTVTSVKVLRHDVIREPATEATDDRGGTPSGRSLLASQRIVGLERRGKQLAIVGDAGTAICIHLGMSGRLLVRPQPLPVDCVPPHTHCIWRLRDSHRRSALLFVDPRRFGGIWSFPSLASLFEQRWRRLGPDAASISAAQLRSALRQVQRPVKAVLLDQSKLAGLGNIYVDESLFRAAIHPRRSADSLSDAELRRLARSIRLVLLQAIQAGGSTIRDYVDGNGRAGAAQARHCVYGRGGLPCLACGQALAADRILQRTTVFCEHCQPTGEEMMVKKASLSLR